MEPHNPFNPITAFKKYDKANNGYLNWHQVKCALIYLTGEKPNYQQSKLLRPTNSQHIDSSTFTSIYSMHCNNLHFEPERAIVGCCFETLDTSNNKYISLDDFRKCESLLACSSEGDMLDCFYEIDSNKDGKVTYKDFNEMMKFRI